MLVITHRHDRGLGLGNILDRICGIRRLRLRCVDDEGRHCFDDLIDFYADRMLSSRLTKDLGERNEGTQRKTTTRAQKSRAALEQAWRGGVSVLKGGLWLRLHKGYFRRFGPSVDGSLGRPRPRKCAGLFHYPEIFLPS